MKAALTPRYGAADVMQIHDVPRPVAGPGEVLVRVHAAAVTQGDRRMRAADFPGFTALIGRLMFGVRRPRKPVQGTMFAGEVVEVGDGVTAYAPGDRIFGGVMHGAYAEYLRVPEDAPMARVPDGVSYEEAAATPYGAGTALHFLRDVGKLQPGERLLVLGASGGVGRFAVQLGKRMGAHVTGVCSGRNAELVRGLGADAVIDHRTTDVLGSSESYDVVFDIADATTFCESRRILAPRGRYMALALSVGVLVQQAVTSLFGGRRALFSIAEDNRERMQELGTLLADGVIPPVVGARFELDQVVQAHRAEEARQAQGAVVVRVAAAEG